MNIWQGQILNCVGSSDLSEKGFWISPPAVPSESGKVYSWDHRTTWNNSQMSQWATVDRRGKITASSIFCQHSSPDKGERVSPNPSLLIPHCCQPMVFCCCMWFQQPWESAFLWLEKTARGKEEAGKIHEHQQFLLTLHPSPLKHKFPVLTPEKSYLQLKSSLYSPASTTVLTKGVPWNYFWPVVKNRLQQLLNVWTALW